MSQTLKLYIPKVLSENKLVILKGIGSLKINYRSASLDPDRKVIMPPREEIYFVPSSESKIDPVLVKIVEMVAQVGSEEATDVVYRFMKDLVAELRAKGQVALPSIGWIRQDKWGSIFFEPAAEYISLNRYFGLNQVKLPEALTQAEQEVLADLKETVSEKATTPVYDITKRRKWGFIISTLLVLMVVASLFLIRNWNDSEMVHEEIPVDTTKVVPNTEDDGTFNDLNQKEQPTLLPEDVKKGGKIDVGPNFIPVLDKKGELMGFKSDPPGADCNYAIIVGAFANDRNVRKMIERIRASDHESVLIKGGTLTKVGLRIDCHDYDETLAWAKAELAAEAWVYEGVPQ